MLRFCTLSILLFCLSSAAFAQDCQPSPDHCDYYLYFEQSSPCGPDGYALQFGKKNCERYLRAEPKSLPEVQTWYQKVRFCLQNALSNILLENSEPLNCKQIEKIALRSHIYCYVETGFCELSKEAKSQIYGAAGLTLLTPSAIKTGFKILRACEKRSNHE